MPDLVFGYSYRVMPCAELIAHIHKHHASVFAANQHIDPGYAYSQVEQHALDTLGKT